MPPASRLPPPASFRRPASRAARRGPGEISAIAYTIFYSGTGFGIALLIYASFFLSAPPPQLAGIPETPKVLATIRLNQSDGKGRCRQIVFDNASGRFSDGGFGRCPDLIPQDMLVQTVRARSILAQSFNRAFR